jgi:hypothetical protein
VSGGDGIESFLSAAPQPSRAGLRLLLALARRPRGRGLLARVPPAEQAAQGVLALGHYDRPEVAARLGWDAEAVAARGRELRHTEGRP